MDIPKDYNEFRGSLDAIKPPGQWPEALQALWWDAKDDWEASHNIAQDIPTDLGSWIHGYLHRKEGDEWNAGYWYRRAGRPFPKLTLDQELQQLVEYVIGH